MGAADPIGVVEAAYRVDVAPDVWLRGVATAIRPVLDLGAGVTGLLLDSRGAVPAAPRVIAAVGIDVPDQTVQFHVQMSAASATMQARRAFVAAGAVGILSRIMGAAYQSPHGPRALLEAAGAADTVFLLSCPLDDLVCVLTTNVPYVVTGLPRQKVRLLERLSAHVAAGCRLLHPRVLEGVEAPDAVLDPRGKLQDARGDAARPDGRAALREAALASERARGSLRRRSPGEAVEIWRALVAGQWSLVDHFDSDGKRHLIARRNERLDPVLRPLTRREHQVAQLAAQGHGDKLIAYELGLSTGSVATHLTRARAKLGVRSRVELVQAILAGPVAEGGDADE